MQESQGSQYPSGLTLIDSNDLTCVCPIFVSLGSDIDLFS